MYYFIFKYPTISNNDKIVSKSTMCENALEEIAQTVKRCRPLSLALHNICLKWWLKLVW